MKKIILVNVGGGPVIKEDGFGFTEGGLVHAASALSNLASDYDITIICPNLPEGGQKQITNYKGVKIICLQSSRRVRWMHGGELSLTESFWRTIFHWSTILENYKQASRYIKEEQPDILIGNAMFACSLLRFVQHVPFKVGIIHHLYHASSVDGSSRRMVRIIGILERLALRLIRLDKIGVVNPMVKDSLVKRGFRQEDIVVVGNGVDPCDYSFCENKTPHSLIYIGSFRKLKRTDSLIKVVSRVRREVPYVILHMVGDGPEYEEVSRNVKSSGMGDSIVMHGYLSEKEKINLLASCEIYVSNSSFEGFGIPLVEAMATGTVPVVSNIPSHRFIFQDRDVGYLVDSTEEMAARIIELLADETKRLQLAQSGRKLVEEKWTWAKVGEHYRELLQSL